MQSAKKTKILSALSMAAAAVLTAKAAHAATLTLFYGQDASYANSNNNIVVGSSYSPTTTIKNSQLQRSTLGGAAVQNVSNSAPTTLTLPIGSYLSLAIDAVLTGNANPDAGATGGATPASPAEPAQPAFLGLSELSVGVSSTDQSAHFLTPISTATKTLSQFGGINTYSGTAIVVSGTAKGLNGGQGTNGGGGYNVLPNWGVSHVAADVAPNATGFDAPNGNGNYGLNGLNTGGSTSVDPSSASGVGQLEAFTTPDNTASYANATEYVHSMIFQGLTAGTVTLQPYTVGSGTQYWVNTGAAGGGSPSAYGVHTFGAGDVINTLPVLVINVVGGTTAPTSHAILSLAATAAANTNYGSTVGALHITGSAAAGYTTAQVTGLSSGTGNVTTDAWNATTDPEVYGVDVKVGGVQATPAQLTALLAAIAGDGAAPASAGVTASTTDLSGGALSALDTGSTTYNLFLKYAGGGPSIPLDDLGIDLSSSNDSNLTGYTFSAVSVVPEPMSLGLLALGGVGLMSRRSRRKA